MRIETQESLFMFLLNNTNYKYSNNYACRNDHHDDRTWTGEPFQGWSGKETFTKEAELSKLGILPKSGIS